MTPNQRAFLDTIAVSEGTYGKGDNGYNVLVGGRLFDSYDDHPRQLVKINDKLFSTAAGRYQLLAKYYDYYSKLLGLNDFSPASQDAIALRQIKERNALDFIEANDFPATVDRVKNIWASLPGAGYGQHENSLEKLQADFDFFKQHS